MLSKEFRSNFLKFFKEKGHTVVPSSSVVPFNDPSLLFANAGMNQFKDVFLGMSKRDYTRATSCQKCLRGSDLENVGHTARHLTFFEMLGNFSFGDYFKEQAIDFAWDVTKSVFQYDLSKVHVTVYYEDKEAFDLWLRYLPKEKITCMGDKDNFWSMGPTGPCGPCTELYFDRGPQFGSARNPSEDSTGDRFIEYWNLVFMQYNRLPTGKLEPLPKKSVDTGAGLERLLCLKLNVSSVYDTDVLREIIASTENLSGKKYISNSEEGAPFRVIADHLRSLSFAIADGAQPSNIERGYMLRKILRRAVRYGKNLGFDEPFLAKLLPTLITTMGDDYPELKESEARIALILTEEEENFFKILKRGGTLLNNIIKRSAHDHRVISGEDAFKLKDTYGLPLEEIMLLAKDDHLTVDLESYDRLENEARERSKKAQETELQLFQESTLKGFHEKNGPTAFVGYLSLNEKAKIIGIVKAGQFVEKLEAGEEGSLLLDKTPLYAEKGGQVGDRGKIFGKEATFDVLDCQTPYGDLILHIGMLKTGTLKVNDEVVVAVDAQRRKQIANNHTATHLLHLALQKVLGQHVRQAGSLVEPTRLRFDFSHHKALTQEEIRQIEDLTNATIQANIEICSYEMQFEEVKGKKEIKQFFGEKYSSRVRIVDIEESKELCGGTHTLRTGDIGFLKIVEEKAIAAGMRRIEAVTGLLALQEVRRQEDLIASVLSLFKVQEGQLIERTKKFIDERRCLECELNELKRKLIAEEMKKWLDETQKIGPFSYLVKQIAIDPLELKMVADLLLEEGNLALFLITEWQGRLGLWAALSSSLVQKGLSASEWLKAIAPIVGGKGGGKPETAQGGGPLVDKAAQAKNEAEKWISDRLKKL